jgi:putative ABC transport system permease protein
MSRPTDRDITRSADQPTTQSVNRPITKSPNGSMFWRLWRRSLTIKRPQAGLAIASVLVGAAVASMLLNLYADVRRKMTQEFRAYGPNVVLAPRVAGAGSTGAEPGGATSAFAGVMDETLSARLQPLLARTPGAAAVPVLYVVARLKRLPPDPRLPEFENLVAVGTDFAALDRLNPSWRLSGGQRASDGTGAVIGSRVAKLLHLSAGDQIALEEFSATPNPPPQATQAYRVTSVLSTGASEDDQVFVPLASLQKLAGLEGKISLVELSIPGETAEVQSAVTALARELPEVEVRPIRQIVYSSGHVLATIRWLTVSLTGLIVIIIALCVMATMTTIVLERRKDIAVMKALGASDRLVMELFLSEGAALGMMGALGGFALGLLLARGLAERLFSVTLSPAWWTLPVVAVAGTLLAVASTLVPVRIVRGVKPATMLKGE